MWMGSMDTCNGAEGVMLLDYTLLDPPPNEGDLPDPPPDPRDWLEHCEACQRIAEELRCKKKCLRQSVKPADNPPTDDAPLSALEPFGVDSELLGILDRWLRTVQDARAVLATGEKLPYLGDTNRRTLAQAVAAATRWLAKNPPNRPKSTYTSR
jgi:hypothetical protein